MMCIAFGASAQTNTFYFMDEVPTRHSMNPAFIPNTAWYWNIIFPSVYVEGGSNVFALKDVLMKNNNEWVTALHPSQDINKLYNRIPRTTEIGTRFKLDVINFGFRAKEKNYFTFDLGLRGDVSAYIPKDLFKFAFVGAPDEFGINKFNLKNLGVNGAVYGELGLGYMRKISDKVNFGFKLKGLVGVAGAYSKINKANLSASGREWNMDWQGDAYLMTPKMISWDTKDSTFRPNDPIFSKNWKDYIQGFGGAIDLGITYEPIKNLVISAAVTDLGFIRWNKPQDMVHVGANGSFAFKGIEFKVGKDVPDNYWQNIGDSLKNELSGNYTIENGGKKINQMLTANVNVGIEYGVLDNKISFGALSNTRINQTRVVEEVTLAVNFRPADWFKTYFSYTFFDGKYNNIGLGLSFRMGPVNTFLVMDYIPLNWIKTSNLYEGQTKAIPLPYGTSRFNVQMGLTFNFGRDSSDKDKDGVRNSKDKCPDTNIKALMKLCPDVKRKDFVDKNGCTKDEDSDGVPDCYDRCPNTPLGYPVDEYGCPFDEDGDGVPDHLDKCPGTPAGVAVDEHGCPFDTDGDGVPDYLDKCPGTPAGVAVDEHGCPFDEDGDGVPDYLDKCPGTPKAAYGFVDEHGCPKDTDGDGVPDYLDKCPNTPKGAIVDKDGCPKDTDGDGVPDYLDKCPGTPAAARGFVDENGCPTDTDGDGVPDYLDKCPNTPKGVQVDKDGCPQVKASVKKIFEKALQGIQFETGKDVIKPVSFPILNDIVKIMKENPSYLLQINGHTDNVGNPESNQILSEKRAISVKNYLVSKGVAENRLTPQGFGDTKPVVPNNSAANRAKNRRVEFVVKFEEIVTEE